MPDQIFISYRRNDAAYVTGHINDLLRQEFGDEAVFTDVDNIALGVDFRTVIDETVSQCQVFLAVIGAGWLSARNHDGKPRLRDPADFVRIEVESALKRNIPVIPLLVSGAQMPAAEDLPESLRDLAYRNGTPIRPAPDFTADMARLIKNLRKHFGTLRADDGAAGQVRAGSTLITEPPSVSPARTEPADPESSTKRNQPASSSIHVARDESARKRAELGVGQQKKRRWGTSVWGLAIVLGAIAGWYYVDRNPETFAELLSDVRTAPPGSEEAATAGTEQGSADNRAGEASTAVVAPARTAPAESTETNEASVGSTGAKSTIDASVDSATAAEFTEPATAEAARVMEGAPKIESIEVIIDNESDALAEAGAGMVDQPESVGDVIDNAANDLGASAESAIVADTDDEITMTPGSQRQSDASALIGEGVRLAAVGDHETAIQNFSEALDLEIEQAFLYKQRAASYQALGLFEAAILDYDQTLALNSDDLIAVYNRGVAHIALQNYAAAIADFDIATGLDPEFVDAYSRRADAHESLGNLEAAARDRAVVSVFEANRNNRR